MPIYEYHCKQCGSKFEKLVKLSTKTAEVECPKCGAKRAEKSVSRFGTLGSTSSGGSSFAWRAAKSHGASCGPVG